MCSTAGIDDDGRKLESLKRLLMAGARDSFGLGGYAFTPIEEVLPASFDLRRRRDRASLAMVAGPVPEFENQALQAMDELIAVGKQAQEAGELKKELDIEKMFAFIEDAGKGAMVSMKALGENFPLVSLAGGSEAFF